MSEPINTGAAVKRNRFYGVIILVCILGPMGLAYTMFHTGWGVSGTTTNKGELLNPPLAIQELVLTENVTAVSDLFVESASDLSVGKKWRLLIPVYTRCENICQNNLFLTRQVHIRLAEKAYRVERIILALEDLPIVLEETLEQEHRNTRRANSSVESFYQWLNPTGLTEKAEEYYYLVDQNGFVMMRYHSAHTGQDLLDDIKRLLKFTYDK